MENIIGNVWYFALNRQSRTVPSEEEIAALADEVLGNNKNGECGLLRVISRTKYFLTFAFGQETPESFIHEFARRLEEKIKQESAPS